jgi:hypothetical protein
MLDVTLCYCVLLCIGIQYVVTGVAIVKVKGAELHKRSSSSPGQMANTLKIKTPLMFYLKKVMYLEEGSVSQADEHSDQPETALRANRCHCVSVCIYTEKELADFRCSLYLLECDPR